MTDSLIERSDQDLQLAYSYSLSYLARLGERTALKFKSLFPTYKSFVSMDRQERVEATKRSFGSNADGVITTNLDELMERAVSDLRDHELQGIKAFSIDSDLYPELLKQISDPPLVLFVKGSIQAVSQNSNIAVVGTRDATPTGEKVAFKIAKWFGEHEWCVVSGLAKGIDSAAHKGALEANFRTVAVMATPLDKIYPVENRQLATAILDCGGCWISELPLWKKPHRGGFVQRDRIQSGLSVAIVPVQTDLIGGTMHTVRYAEQQGRKIFCPRPIPAEHAAKQYAGIKSLIDSHKAIPFSGDEYGRVLESLKASRDALLTAANQQWISIKSSSHEKKQALPDDKSKVPPHVKVPKSNPQAGFGFIVDASSRKVLTSKRKSKARDELQVLEALRDEILRATKPDGQDLRDVQDVIEWLDKKIEGKRTQKVLA